MIGMTWLPRVNMAGCVTTLRSVERCDGAEIEARLGFAPHRLAQGWALYELIDPVGAKEYIWSDKTRYSGGTVDEPSVVFKGKDGEPDKIATVPRFDDRRAELGKKHEYDEKKVDDALRSILADSHKRLNTRHGNERIVKIVPRSQFPPDYPDSRFTNIPQWTLTAKKSFRLMDVVPDPETRIRLSGSAWWHANQAKYANSNAVADLASGFREKVETFLKALRAAGATARVSATLRNHIRAYLMHYSYRLSRGNIRAIDIPPIAGCDIVWDHGIEARSRAAALEMVELFDIVYQPSLTSLHIKGLAIDMSISWTGTIKVKDALGKVTELGAPQSGAKNIALHGIGKTYGVIKLLSDAPHWSSTGR